VTMVAEKLFSAQQLKVFTELPEDEITTRIHDTFVPEASSARLPKDASEWNWMRNRWRAELERHCFAGWPEDVALPESRRVGKAASGGISLEMLDFESQEHVPMRLYKLSRESLSKPGIQRLSILDADDWSTWMKSLAVGFPGLLSEEMESVDGGQDRFEEIRSQLLGADETWNVMAPRGIGMTAPLGSIKKQRQIRRRYQLLGQTVDAMRVWDIRSAIRVIRSLSEAPIHIQGKRDMATNVLMASVFESGVKRVDLWELSSSFETGPDYLNIIRFVDLPTAVALSAEMQDVHLHRTEPHGWDYPMTVALKLGWTQGRFQVHGP